MGTPLVLSDVKDIALQSESVGNSLLVIGYSVASGIA